MFLNTIRTLSSTLFKASSGLSIGNKIVSNNARNVYTSLVKYNELSVEDEMKRDSPKDRSTVVPAETSIEYLKSDAYKSTYGNDPVWKEYRRNHKGSIPPKKTRKMCIRSDMIATGNPCPICRDEYLILDYRNVDLLKQFISPYSGKLLSYKLTGICQKQHENLIVAVKKAKDWGFIKFDLPIKHYNYDEFKNSN
ncbi:28S ribosomal protein S18b, mitochondrial [Melanaphis sacchari]|uniref:Small ribosomal subunit protein mS40 n=1 Tax=Melanaphis sacchari TaxID=742174 RepID=A0A2H8TR26_9HEMI|nr:28S ribosomal protein S18b, mitochondrial [Melanaphis sacchari]